MCKGSRPNVTHDKLTELQRALRPVDPLDTDARIVAWQARRARLRKRLVDHKDRTGVPVILASLDQLEEPTLQTLDERTVDLGDLERQLDFIERSSSGLTLIDGDTLVERFGGREPRGPRLSLRGMKRRSVAYSQVKDALDAYQRLKPNVDDEGVLDQMLEQLQRVIDGALAYIAKHRKAKKKRSEVEAMSALLDVARAERDMWLAVKRAGGTPSVQVLGELRHQHDYLWDSIDPRLDDEHLTTSKPLGKGQVNTVHELEYTLEDGTTEVRVFKSLEEPPPPPNRFPWICGMLGIDREEPRYGERNICSRIVSEMLGLDELMPTCSLVVHDHTLGLVMGLAPGVTPRRNHLDIESDPGVQASYLEKLVELQWLDLLCGQGDRHSENYLVDITDGVVRITGIDNDAAFGSKHDRPHGSTTGVLLPVAYHTPTDPIPVVSRKTADRILGFDMDGFSTRVRGMLEDGEIQSTAGRLAGLQQEVRDLERDGRVVTNWSTHVIDGLPLIEWMLSEDAPNTYYKRDLLANRKNEP